MENKSNYNFRALKIKLAKKLGDMDIFPNIYFVKNPFKIVEFFELLKDIKISKEDTILDIGCGGGIQTSCLGRMCKHITGIDINCESINSARLIAHIANVDANFICTTIEEEEFPDESFDKIISICVIEHIPNYKETLREVYRTLKNDCEFICSVDSLTSIESNILISKHKSDHKVIKYFDARELEMLLKETGFQKIKIYPIFKSDYAKKLFIKGIKNHFQFGYSNLLDYFIMRLSEARTKNMDGIFLIAKCKKIGTYKNI
jgi:2-polyprenyl-3-methyl-5-hydroxy-6-metoxy-1,4-benzoquinol methylase